MPRPPPAGSTTWARRTATCSTSGLAGRLPRQTLEEAETDWRRRVRPAFRECQCRRREWPPLTFPRPGSPLSLDAVANETRAERRDQDGAHAIAPVGKLVRLRVDEQRLAD